MKPDPSPPSADVGVSPARRRALVWTTAGLAAAAGAGAAWYLNGASRVADDGAALWTQQFDRPDGSPLDLAGLRAGGRLIVNFWATWCPPCVAELPMLDRFAQTHGANGWRVLGLAVDTPSSVRKFLETRPVAFPIGMAGLQGTELSRALGNTQGSLPFTVVFAANGSVSHRKIGQLSENDLVGWM